MFLGKPRDDLRKDARLMDLNAIINKLLKGNSESRKRQLRGFVFGLTYSVTDPLIDIRTYGVVTLNEECGFIQWVPNTTPIRPILVKYYDARRIKAWVWCWIFSSWKPMLTWVIQSGEMSDAFKKIKESATDKQSADLFRAKILSVWVLVVCRRIPILILSAIRFKPVFHEWFIETFPEPTAWLTSRLMYGRTVAVMCMVGFILGFVLIFEKVRRPIDTYE